MDNIPKIIHYCWFGGNPLPDEYKNYIEGWKKKCENYDIIEWNENNFDVNVNSYVKEAYQQKKWAFVTDYVRLYALYNYGGIYMDTDVEIIKSLDDLLCHKAFSGFESNNYIPTGIMAGIKNFPLYKEFLDYYNDKHFISDDGVMDLTTNVAIITQLSIKYGLKRNNTYQVINDWALYPNDYFCPKDYKTGKINITDNTYVIHHFGGSWQSSFSKKIQSYQQKCYNLFGKKLGMFIFYITATPIRCIHSCIHYGFFKGIKLELSKFSKKL